MALCGWEKVGDLGDCDELQEKLKVLTKNQEEATKAQQEATKKQNEQVAAAQKQNILYFLKASSEDSKSY